MGRKQPFESFLKNVWSEQLVFWGLMHLYQFEYYLQQIFIIILAVLTRGSFRGRVSESLFIKQNRPTLNKHGTSFPLKLFKQQNDESRYIFRTRSNNWWSSLRKSLQISVVDCFKKSLVQMFGRFLNAPFKSLLMSLHQMYHHLFFLLGAPLSIWQGVFLRKQRVDFSCQLFPRQSSILDV